MQKILAVEDSKDTQFLIQQALKSRYQVVFADSCAEARNLMKTQDNYSLVLIDKQLPDGNGFDLYQEWISDDSSTEIPHIFLTADNSVSSVIHGFTLGADDYIVKPFNPLELLARLDARISKITKQKTPVSKIVRGPLELDHDTFHLYINSSEGRAAVSLTPIEFRILFKLAHYPGRVFSRKSIIDQVWGTDHFIEQRSIDKHISSLRSKLRPYESVIKTRSGLGYYFELPESAAS